MVLKSFYVRDFAPRDLSRRVLALYTPLSLQGIALSRRLIASSVSNLFPWFTYVRRFAIIGLALQGRFEPAIAKVITIECI